MNTVQLLGRLTKDVELRYINGAQGQTAVGRFTIAIDRAPKQDGTHDTDFINCQAWGKRAETLSQYFQKGSKIAVTGSIRTGSYTNNRGLTVYTTDVEVIDFDFVDRAPAQPNAATPGYNMQQGQAYYQQGQAYYQQAPQQAPKQTKGKKAAQPAPQPVPVQQAQPVPVQQAQPVPVQQAQPVPVQQAQPANAYIPQDIQAQGGWATPDPVMDDGLPFN